MAMNNPYLAGPTLTPALQQRQQELQASLDWLNTILSGGMPEGFVPTLQNWGQVLDLLGEVAAQRGAQAIAPAMARWVDPAASGALGRQLQRQAMTLLARLADQSQVDPRLVAFLERTPATVQGYGVRADILSQLAPTFANQPWFQRLYSQFLQSAAPGGSVVGMPVPVWAAVAQPYFAMQNLLGAEGYAQAGLPQVQFPQTAANMPRQAQNIVRAIHEAALATQGYQLGPEGIIETTPLQRHAAISSLLGPLARAGWGETGDPTAGFPGYFGQPLSPPAPGAFGQTADRGSFINWMRNALSGVRDAVGRLAQRAVSSYRGPQPPGDTDWATIKRFFPTPAATLEMLGFYTPADEEEARAIEELRRLAIQYGITTGAWPD